MEQLWQKIYRNEATQEVVLPPYLMTAEIINTRNCVLIIFDDSIGIHKAVKLAQYYFVCKVWFLTHLSEFVLYLFPYTLKTVIVATCRHY